MKLLEYFSENMELGHFLHLNTLHSTGKAFHKILESMVICANQAKSAFVKLGTDIGEKV